MGTINFTDRELKKAWRELSAVATLPEGEKVKNPHRLLLFYAVECGLKLALLKRQRLTVFGQEEINGIGHDLRKALTKLKAGSELSLPENFQLKSIRYDKEEKKEEQRNGDITILHQVWRYGGELKNPIDKDCEDILRKVLVWIEGEIK